MKDKKSKTVLKGVIETVNESKCKPNKLWTTKMVRQKLKFIALN